jgi:hypothetical protein
MRQSDLTKWGEFLQYVRGLCGGLILAIVLSDPGREANLKLWLVALIGLTASFLLTPLLRSLGWRGLAESIGKVPATPRPADVERALHLALRRGLPLPEAIRILHQSRGWDVMELYPAVAKVADLPPKEAIRLVMTETVLAGSSAAP